MDNPPTTCMTPEGIIERRRTVEVCTQIALLSDKLNEHGDKISKIETNLTANTSATEEVLDILRLGKSFFRLAGIFGSVVKWCTAIAASILGLWYTIKSGHTL